MAEFYKGTIPIIEDTTAHADQLYPPEAKFGLVPRDYSVDPEPMFSPPGDMRLYDPSEYDALYNEQEELQSSLEHIYLSGPGGKPAFVNLDQDGDGDCWCYSTGHAMMLDRLKQNLIGVRLNPHFIATYLRRFNGGWCGASAKVAREVGCAPVGTEPGDFPQWSHDTSKITAAVMTEAGKYKVTEDWMDLTREVYDQKMTAKQLASCSFNNIPCPSDFNWWGHSVCQVRWVRIEAGSWGPLILNSWKGWGRYGLAVLRGSQATANGALGIRLTSG